MVSQTQIESVVHKHSYLLRYHMWNIKKRMLQHNDTGRNIYLGQEYSRTRSVYYSRLWCCIGTTLYYRRGWFYLKINIVHGVWKPVETSLWRNSEDVTGLFEDRSTGEGYSKWLFSYTIQICLISCELNFPFDWKHYMNFSKDHLLSWSFKIGL